MDTKEDLELIDGGEVNERGNVDVNAGEVESIHAKSIGRNIRMDDARTARHIAYGCGITLIVSVFGHYTITMILTLSGSEQAIEPLRKIYDTWLPVLTGFTGTSVAYYLKERSR
jgi:hypothetical protein